MQSKLYNFLRKLKSSGPDGFEGLIAKLLESLTEKRFFLAKSGFQFGCDMSTGETSSNTIFVECKRFLKNTSLKDREWLGELEQAHLAHPDLDLWVLVASRDVTSQLQTQLSLSARDKGLEILIIETSDGNPSSLFTLCAAAPDVAIDFIVKNQPNVNKLELQNILNAISNLPDYSNCLKRLKDNLSPAYIGYDNWRSTQNIWLKERFASERHSRAAFSQLLNVGDEKIKLVEREESYKKLDKWLSKWSREHNFFVMLGEEGDGKTWTIASWLNKCLDSHKTFPGTVFLTSQRISSDDPEELIANAIVKQAGRQSTEYWKKRINNWMQRLADEFPLIILVIDVIILLIL